MRSGAAPARTINEGADDDEKARPVAVDQGLQVAESLEALVAKGRAKSARLDGELRRLLRLLNGTQRPGVAPAFRRRSPPQSKSRHIVAEKS